MSRIRTDILERLGQGGPMTTEELALAVGRTKMALRYHLSCLERDGLITYRPGEPHRGVGRPQATIVLAEKAYEYLPKQYARLANGLLDGLGTVWGSGRTRGMLRRLGRCTANSIVPGNGRLAIPTRLNRVTKGLAELGYFPRWEPKGAGFSLYLRNCPYRLVRQAHPEVCEMDWAMLAAVFDGAKVTRAPGALDGQCKFSIESQKRTKVR